MRLLVNHRWWMLLLGLLVLGWSFLPGSQQLENAFYTRLAALMPASEMPDKAVLVTFDDGPVSYLDLAHLLDSLKQARVSAIGLALSLDRSQTRLGSEEQARLREALKHPSDAPLLAQLDPDVALWAALSSIKGTVLAVPAMDKLPALEVEAPSNALSMLLPALLQVNPAAMALAPPLEMFKQQTTPAMLTLADTRAASHPLTVSINGQYYPGFALALATRALGMPLDSLRVYPGKGLKMGTAWYATDASLRVYPRKREAARPLLQLSAEQLLSDAQSVKQLRGKAVIIGPASGPMLQPVQIPGDSSVSKLNWIAQVVDAIINESFVNVPYWALGAQRGAVILVTLYLLLLPMRLRANLGLALGFGVAFLTLNGNLLMLIVHNTWLPLGLPVVLLVLGHGLLWLHYRISHHHSGLRNERDTALAELSANLRSQGKLDRAFDRLARVPASSVLQEELYQLGLDFERRRQFDKALAAYECIAEEDDDYRDIRDRRVRHQPGVPQASLAATTVSYASTKLVVDDPKVERPVLGRYEIESELGRGAMGTVYLGRDPRISRTVAIKTLALSEEFESGQLEEVRRRFFQEAETAGRLNHPNIVTIYDVGEEHDLAYIAMDYITGDSLDQHIKEEDLLPIHQVFAIGVQVAEALHYAHEQKVVHRDVKPGNIIYDHDKGQLKVTDFGIACLTDNSKTRTGTVLGSPYYMSPEQIAGKKVDGRSDLFSLGVTLYQLFTGRLPFEGDSLTNLMYQITNEKPKGIRKLRPELPACLTRLINKALEKNPDKRFDNGQAMAEAIRRCEEKM